LTRPHKPTVTYTKPSTPSVPVPPIVRPAPAPPVAKTKPVAPKTVTPIEWFITEWGVGEPSPAEALIITELNRYPIQWEREVSFRGLQLASLGWARFDFYLPAHNLCIEYQGAGYHDAPERVASDELKATFCRNNNIKLIYLDRNHYFKMPYTISKIMKGLNIERIK
jgi:hypothetical protein